MKEYKGIGFSIPSENDDYVRLDSFTSLADSDIAIFCPDLSTTSYSTYNSGSYSSSGEYEGEEEEEEERRKERHGEKNHTLPPHSEFLFNLNAHNTTTHI